MRHEYVKRAEQYVKEYKEVCVLLLSIMDLD